jgi:hypothetical protein
LVVGHFSRRLIDLVAAGPVKTSLGKPPLARPKTASPSPPRFVQARLNSQSASSAERNTIEFFDEMHRPSIDMRPFARSKNRRAPALIERWLSFVSPLKPRQSAASIQRNLCWARFRLSVLKAIRPTSPRWSLRHAGRFLPTVTRLRDPTC